MLVHDKIAKLMKRANHVFFFLFFFHSFRNIPCSISSWVSKFGKFWIFFSFPCIISVDIIRWSSRDALALIREWALVADKREPQERSKAQLNTAAQHMYYTPKSLHINPPLLAFFFISFLSGCGLKSLFKVLMSVIFVSGWTRFSLSSCSVTPERFFTALDRDLDSIRLICVIQVSWLYEPTVMSRFNYLKRSIDIQPVMNSPFYLNKVV